MCPVAEKYSRIDDIKVVQEAENCPSRMTFSRQTFSPPAEPRRAKTSASFARRVWELLSEKLHFPDNRRVNGRLSMCLQAFEVCITNPKSSVTL